MKVLVIGGTGKTGRELIKQGLDRGHTITAIARKPDRLKVGHSDLRPIRGNVLDSKSLEMALSAQDAVLCALGHKKFVIPTRILSKGTFNLIVAMEAQKVRRLVCITSLGINDSRFRLGVYYSLFVVPLLILFYFRDKEKQERLLRKSGLNWTIIRPGHLTDGKRKERYRTGANLGHYLFTRYISRADVAHFMWEVLEQNLYLREVSGITY